MTDPKVKSLHMASTLALVLAFAAWLMIDREYGFAVVLLAILVFVFLIVTQAVESIKMSIFGNKLDAKVPPADKIFKEMQESEKSGKPEAEIVAELQRKLDYIFEAGFAWGRRKQTYNEIKNVKYTEKKNAQGEIVYQNVSWTEN